MIYDNYLCLMSAVSGAKALGPKTTAISLHMPAALVWKDVRGTEVELSRRRDSKDPLELFKDHVVHCPKVVNVFKKYDANCYHRLTLCYFTTGM